MSDLIDNTEGTSNAHEFTVSEISGAVKRVIEGEFGYVRVRGEVGRTMHARSGHLYFDLKDDRAVISAVSWKGQVARLAVMPEEGMEVVATGRLTTFPGQSKYQLIVDSVEPAGAGALMAMLEKRKKQLQAEGLFDAARKKKLPYLPEVIGVVTSPSGAVIRDILHRLRDRFPRQVLIWPVAVQGKDCAPQVARAIAGFNDLQPGGPVPRPDLLIVARGGGSVEDLWGFNEEIVARAAAASDIPLISAVGHETDTTLIDYVADVRAPTPTAAAELAVPVRLDLLAWTGEQEARLSRALTQNIGQKGQRLRDLTRALPKPDRLLDGPRQRLDRSADRLPQALQNVVQRRRLRLSEVSASLRPAMLNRRVGEAARQLADRSVRLRPEVLKRAIDGRRTELERFGQRLASAFGAEIRDWRAQLAALERMRQSLGYTETLRRGYAVVRANGEVVTTAAVAQSATMLEIEFADARVTATPAEGGASPSQQRKPSSKKGKPPEQGSLF